MLEAAANPFPLQASFKELDGGGYACKMCGAKLKDQNACTDHLLAKHREMEAYGTSEGVQKEWETRGAFHMGDKLKSTRTGNSGAVTGKDYDPETNEVSYQLNHGGMWLREATLQKTNSLQAHDFSQSRRKKLAKSGKAMPGGGFPIVNRCLAGGTLIPLLNGSAVRIADMVGGEWLYAFDVKSKVIVPAQAKSVIKNGRSLIYRVELDDGAVIRCTGNHPFLLRSGKYLSAAKLAVGDSLMPLYRKQHKWGSGKYEWVRQPFFGFWELTHRMVFRGEYGYLPDNGLNADVKIDVHHKSEIKSDNSPSNLVALTQSEHRKQHWLTNRKVYLKNGARGRKNRWAKKGARARQSKVTSRENMRRKRDRKYGESVQQKIYVTRMAHLDAKLPKNLVELYLSGTSMRILAKRYHVTRSAIASRLRRAGVEIRYNPLFWLGRDSSGRLKKSANNHKVVSVQQDGVDEVYDLLVPRTSNFAVAAGVFVHNSDLANAKRAIGRAKNPAAARRHINERARALGAKPIGEDMDAEQFSPSDRLRMPKKAGQGTTTVNPQYTGGQPPLQAKKGCGCEACAEEKRMEALGMRRGGRGGGCSSHGFHRGPGYESKAAKMGHRIPLAASREPLIRQRPPQWRKFSQAFRGYQNM
jgi:hypothetical protein